MAQESYDYYGGANHKIIDLMPKDAERILDIGCAKGELGAVLKKQNPKREIWGIEFVPEIAEEAKSKLDHVLTGDIERMDPLPLPEEAFDCITCGDVLEHLRRPEELLPRLSKHLKANGHIICCVPNVAHWSVVAGLLRGRFDYADKGLLDRTHLTFFTPATFREMLWDTGYVVEVEDAAIMDHPCVQGVFAQAASALGLRPDTAIEALSTYQKVFKLRLKPKPLEQPAKLAQLVGPHRNKLEPAPKRCSVVIVTYNSAKTLEGCLTSILTTLSPDDELIIVDNASSDTTLSKLSTFSDKRIRVIQNSQNIGFAKGCNIGILESKGEFILSLNPDTRVWPGVIESLSAPLRHPSIGAVGPVSEHVAGDAFVGRFFPEWLQDWDVERTAKAVKTQAPALFGTRMLMGYCLMLSRNHLNEYGLLEESTALGADDLELSWRYQELGLSLVIKSNEFVSHEGQASFSSISSKECANAIERSDMALISKLRNYYGILPSSWDIWRSEILSDAMTRGSREI